MINYVEEVTPKSILLKIMLKSWQFIAFNHKQDPIYIDNSAHSFLYKVNVVFFIGKSFDFERDYGKDYTLLKIRQGSMIIPYIDKIENIVKYVMIPYEGVLDLIPVRIFKSNDINEMIKVYDPSIDVDMIIVDNEISKNDIDVVKKRFSVKLVYDIDESSNYSIVKNNWEKERDMVNLNMMSQNPVFLSRIHMREKNISQIKQLLLDFDLTELDTEYIISFIKTEMQSIADDISKKRLYKQLSDLLHLYVFYINLLKKDSENLELFIDAKDQKNDFFAIKTLISKIESVYPQNESFYKEISQYIDKRLDYLNSNNDNLLNMGNEGFSKDDNIIEDKKSVENELSLGDDEIGEYPNNDSDELIDLVPEETFNKDEKIDEDELDEKVEIME